MIVGRIARKASQTPLKAVWAQPRYCYSFFASKSTDWSNQHLCLATQHLLKGGETRKSNKKDQ